jgi:diguanylate cyclase (GGDEF)-like protein/PAS domain S-box-containing protein
LAAPVREACGNRKHFGEPLSGLTDHNLSMNSSRQPQGLGGADSDVGPIRGLLELARFMRGQPSLREVLDALAKTVEQALGFATVAINMYRPDTDEYEVVTVHGNAQAREILLGNVTAADTWQPLLDPRFRRLGVYFIPAGALELDLTQRWYTPDLGHSGVETERGWRADDALFATLDGAGGRRYGVISVDEPASGLRPDVRQLELLDGLATYAGFAIDNARRLAALEGGLARNRALIASSLDCVIGIDQAGNVIEFNPAAERTFGYRNEDVLGRELAQLIIPPEARDAHRQALARGLATGDWRLLGRRIETTAMRADGSLLPVEVTLTLVEGAEDDGPVFYGFIRDIAERRRGEEQLAFLAYHDPLTGLPNRILVEQQLDLALARARRTGGAVALMFVDLDDFKEVNDRLGHAAGDILLAGVAARLRSVLRDSDLLARQGGDEFLVLLADLTEDPTLSAEQVGGKLLSALHEPFVVAGTEARTGASIGVSLYPDDAEDTEALLRHADVSMYQAKTAGGGQIVFHAPSEVGLSRRAGLSAQLRRAIAQDELELHYEPICCLDARGGIAGVEALLRWRHPDRGLLRLEALIGLAEQSSAGEALINWVLGETCRQAREWRDLGLEPTLSVNVSPHQLLTPGYAARFSELVAAHDLDPGHFLIELPETAWTVDAAESLAVIADLRAAGAQLAIDDFGDGYSSLSRLCTLDFDVLKIHRGLLIDTPRGKTAVAVLKAVFGLAMACGASIIADGVETEEQASFLARHGVGRAQGFLFGHPIHADLMTPLLARRLVSRDVA